MEGNDDLPPPIDFVARKQAKIEKKNKETRTLSENPVGGLKESMKPHIDEEGNIDSDQIAKEVEQREGGRNRFSSVRSRWKNRLKQKHQDNPSE